MKTMKKFLMVLLGTALVLSMAGAVAAEDTQTTDGHLNVNYTVTESYTVTIPTSLEMANDKLGTWVPIGSVNVTKNLIESGKYLTVTVSSTNGYNLTHESVTTSKIPYILNYTATASVNGFTTTNNLTASTASTVILNETAGEKDAKTALQVLIEDINLNGVVAGKHTDTLTFTFAVAPETESAQS